MRFRRSPDPASTLGLATFIFAGFGPRRISRVPSILSILRSYRRKAPLDGILTKAMKKPISLLPERRWFASITAVRTMQAECDVLREVMEVAETAWRRARTRLAELESLRDALGDQLTEIDGQYPEPKTKRLHRTVMSAA